MFITEGLIDKIDKSRLKPINIEVAAINPLDS